MVLVSAKNRKALTLHQSAIACRRKAEIPTKQEKKMENVEANIQFTWSQTRKMVKLNRMNKKRNRVLPNLEKLRRKIGK